MVDAVLAGWWCSSICGLVLVEDDVVCSWCCASDLPSLWSSVWLDYSPVLIPGRCRLASCDSAAVCCTHENCFCYLKCIYFWVCWVSVAAQAFLWLRGGISSCGARASHPRGFSSPWLLFPVASLPRGFSSPWLLLLQRTGCRAQDLCSCGSWALEHRLSSCGVGEGGWA